MIYVIYMHMREVNAQFMVMSRYRVVVLSADAVERLREKLLFIGMSSGAAMRC